MKFPSPLPPLQLTPDYYKDNTIATMKKSKVQKAEELKMIRETHFGGGMTNVCQEFVYLYKIFIKKQKNY